MKSLTDILNNIILEKLKVDDIKFDNFPIDGSFDDIISFLKLCEFKELEYPGKKWSELILAFNKYDDGKYFLFTKFKNSQTKCLKFANMSYGEISDKNLLYHIRQQDGKTREFIISNAEGSNYNRISAKEFIDLIYKNKILK